jgi:acetyltransferase-like isoleucine patch superfamily enzyme
MNITGEIKKILKRILQRTGVFPFLREKKLTDRKIRIENGVVINGEVSIGEYTFIGRNTQIGPNCKSIGKYCSIARNTTIGPNNHPKKMLSTSAAFYSPSWGILNGDSNRFNNQSVIIKNDVWIGVNAVIIGDITIGTGAIIAANAVVTKDVPPYAIVAGVPAKIINYRFDQETISELLKSKWWDKSFEEAQKFYDAFHTTRQL